MQSSEVKEEFKRARIELEKLTRNITDVPVYRGIPLVKFSKKEIIRLCTYLIGQQFKR